MKSTRISVHNEFLSSKRMMTFIVQLVYYLLRRSPIDRKKRKSVTHSYKIFFCTRETLEIAQIIKMKKGKVMKHFS